MFFREAVQCAPTMAVHQQGGSPCRRMSQLRNRRQLRRCEAGWEAAPDEMSVRRMTNSIRRDVLASLHWSGEARKSPHTLKWRIKRYAEALR